jgi:hypothetical protein
MQNISTLSLRQAKIENHKKINFSLNHDTIISKTQELEAMSVAKAKEALLSKVIPLTESRQLLSNMDSLKEALLIQFNREPAESLPENITTTPVFSKIEEQSVELSDSARETFARIGARAREAFIEDQIERAMAYNIPYESYGDDYYQLMQDIDKYEFLLEKAKEYCVDWDTSEYDPLALEQEIEEAEHLAYLQNQEINYYYAITRGVER